MIQTIYLRLDARQLDTYIHRRQKWFNECNSCIDLLDGVSCYVHMQIIEGTFCIFVTATYLHGTLLQSTSVLSISVTMNSTRRGQTLNTSTPLSLENFKSQKIDELEQGDAAPYLAFFNSTLSSDCYFGACFLHSANDNAASSSESNNVQTKFSS